MYSSLFQPSTIGYIAEIPPGAEQVYRPGATAADPDGFNPTILLILLLIAAICSVALFFKN
ncbi:hypothetical protein C7B76_14915 [filamentous cyanobacterium CCP2]|nr:hypothetical protein C7B76_14915 [filamentous cyanobacterium CCP2]